MATDTLRVAPTRLSPEEESLRAEVREFLDHELPQTTSVVLGQAGGWDPDFSRKLGARGWIGITIPEQFGGGGGTMVQRFIVTEELLAAQAPVTAHWVADRQTAPSILLYGTDEQRARFLPQIARGELYFAIGLSEPEAGSDLSAVRTRARRVTGGWRVSGRKVWTSGADRAHYIGVLCRTDDTESRHAGLSQLLVELDADGVIVDPILTLDGRAEFCEVTLDNVFVPDEMLLGSPGDGWEQVTSELAYERYGPERWLSTWGVYRRCLEALAGHADAADYATIGALAARFRVIRQMSLAVARLIDGGGRPVLESAMVKDVGTHFEQAVTETVRELLEREWDPTAADEIERVMSSAILLSPTFTLRGGTTEILRGIVGRGMGR